MSFEWHVQSKIPDHLEKVYEDSTLPDAYCRALILAQTLPYKDKNITAKNLLQTQLSGFCPPLAPFEALGFQTPKLSQADLGRLPPLSFFLRLSFTLDKPYISRDDAPFYVHENPVKKDWVLKTPLIAPTAWKGAFRAALRDLQDGDDRAEIVERLMGSTKAEDAPAEAEEFCQGRLMFYPTFFDRIAVEIINPHDRGRSAGSSPIQIECVPRGAKGDLAVLYTPLFYKPDQPPPNLAEVLADLDATAQALKLMLLERGFGAKTSVGMGRVQPQVSAASWIFHFRSEAGAPFLSGTFTTLNALAELKSTLTQATGGQHV